MVSFWRSRWKAVDKFISLPKEDTRLRRCDGAYKHLGKPQVTAPHEFWSLIK